MAVSTKFYNRIISSNSWTNWTSNWKSLKLVRSIFIILILFGLKPSAVLMTLSSMCRVQKPFFISFHIISVSINHHLHFINHHFLVDSHPNISSSSSLHQPIISKAYQFQKVCEFLLDLFYFFDFFTCKDVHGLLMFLTFT